MRYQSIDAQLYIQNRVRLYAKLKPNSVVIVLANDILPTNADGTLPFKQNSNLFYLSGIDQEEAVVILAPDFPNPKMREILFLKETSVEISIWEGFKLTKAEGTERSGIKNVRWRTAFEQTLFSILSESENVYLASNEHVRNATEVQGANDRFVKWCREHLPLHHYERLAPHIYDLRLVKSDLEIAQMQQACDITEKGFRRVLKATKPDIWEYELEAEYAHEFLINRSRGFAYTPIIAGGHNACVLHYIDNDQKLKDGDLLLMDVGAEYGNYNSDMTRTIPVNGRYTKRQRQVYDAVLRVKHLATELLVSGTKISEYHKEVGRFMEVELIGLGLLDKTDVENQHPDHPEYKKYFMHGTSHHLGLDVHDVGSIYTPIKPGMVLTVEPGIYIREEGIGIRIEDNILITDNGQRNLMKNIPIEAEEIEDLMNSQ